MPAALSPSVRSEQRRTSRKPGQRSAPATLGFFPDDPGAAALRDTPNNILKVRRHDFVSRGCENAECPRLHILARSRDL